MMIAIEESDRTGQQQQGYKKDACMSWCGMIGMVGLVVWGCLDGMGWEGDEEERKRVGWLQRGMHVVR